MGKITDIVKQKRNTSRVSVFVDGEFVCGLDAVTAVGARLKIGDEVTVDELKSVAHKSDVNSAFERAVGRLSAQPRSRQEIRRYLSDKGYDAEVCDEVMKRLDDYHYTDDRAYAESFVRSKSKKYGVIRLKAELRKKGVSQAIITEILDGADDDENAYTEEDGAAVVARRYIKSHKACDKNKLKRFLASRGFTWDAINAAVGVLSDEGAFDSEEADEGYYD